MGSSSFSPFPHAQLSFEPVVFLACILKTPFSLPLFHLIQARSIWPEGLVWRCGWAGKKAASCFLCSCLLLQNHPHCDLEADFPAFPPLSLLGLCPPLEEHLLWNRSYLASRLLLHHPIQSPGKRQDTNPLLWRWVWINYPASSCSPLASFSLNVLLPGQFCQLPTYTERQHCLPLDGLWYRRPCPGKRQMQREQ